MGLLLGLAIIGAVCDWGRLLLGLLLGPLVPRAVLSAVIGAVSRGSVPLSAGRGFVLTNAGICEKSTARTPGFPPPPPPVRDPFDPGRNLRSNGWRHRRPDPVPLGSPRSAASRPRPAAPIHPRFFRTARPHGGEPNGEPKAPGSPRTPPPGRGSPEERPGPAGATHRHRGGGRRERAARRRRL